jgi:CHRD domain
MQKLLRMVTLALMVSGVSVSSAMAQGRIKTRATGSQEVPAVSTPASASLTARISQNKDQIRYTLDYAGLKGDIQQAHLHFAQKGVNGGIVVWLCSNLGNAPAGTPECPAAPATFQGTITASNVVAVNAQGIDAGAFDDLINALQAKLVYLNVHSTRFPSGEVRGQIELIEQARK